MRYAYKAGYKYAWILNNDILIEISKQWGAETKDNFDKINDIDFRAIFRYKMYQKYNKSEIT